MSGQIFHYDGNIWKEYWLSDSILIVNIKALSSDKVYLSGWRFPNGLEVVDYFEWNGGMWTKIEERFGLVNAPAAAISIAFLDGRIISTNGAYISQRRGPGDWRATMNDPNARLSHISTCEGYAFATGRMNDDSEAMYSYNGSTWSRIVALQKANAVIYDTWSTFNTTFSIGMELEPQGTLFPKVWVLRGK
jgi:hypothetical protein